MDIIFSDKCASSVEEVCSTIWVISHTGEEYDEDCLVLHFSQHTTIIVWGAIYRNQKRCLVIQNTPSWSHINGSIYVDHIIRSNLHFSWHFLHLTEQTNSGCIYFKQDNASAHCFCLTQATMQKLGFSNYLLPWPATSLEMSPIEAFQCLLKYRLMQFRPQPTTNPELYQIILKQWVNILAQEIENHTFFMPNWIIALWEAHGGHAQFQFLSYCR